MRRRDFLTIAGGSGVAMFARKAFGAAWSAASAKRKIGYIRPQIPAVAIPPYRGTSYVDHVPDTFDLAERGRLVLNALTSITDPDADYEIYFHLQVFSNPPSMSHDFSDWCQESEGFVEALPLIRQLTGDSLNSEVDRAWTDVLLKSIGPDGLFYLPTEGRPWFYQETHRDVFPGKADPDQHVDMKNFIPTIVLADGPSPSSNTAAYTQYAHPQPAARLLGAMTIFWLRDKNPIWKQTCERMIDRWAELAIYKEDYAYFPRAMFAPGAKAAPQLEMPVGLFATQGSARFIQGLAQYYQATGYEPARVFGQKLVRYVRYHGQYFDGQDGRFLAGPTKAKVVPGMEYNTQGVVYGGHFHAHGISLLSMLDFAQAVKDPELLQFVRKSFEWARDHKESIDLVGFFPTQLVPDLKDMVEHTAAGPVESCEVADMVALGVKLSHAGVGDYWDDVDRWVRNQFAENQLTDTEWIYELAKTQDKIPLLDNESADRPAERNVGGFSGWSGLNDWVVRHKDHRFGIMHCCTGNAARTIFYTWEKMLTHDDGVLKLHLLMNRASPWAEVYSYIPNQGRVDVKIKQPCRGASLRMPEWVQAAQVTCTVNGKAAHFGAAGRYVQLGALRAGDQVKMEFPIHERTEKLSLMGVDYTLIVRGSTVVSIDPPGKHRPYYQRAGMRQEKVPLREVKRFQSEQIISW